MPAGGKVKEKKRKIRFCSFVETLFYWIKISGCCHVVEMKEDKEKEKERRGKNGKKNDKSREEGEQ